MPKSRRRKIIKRKPGEAALPVFPVYYEQTDRDAERCGQIGQAEADARKAAGTWPDETDNSELGLMKMGRALRQAAERAEIEFYRPVTNWFHTHPQYRHRVTSHEQGGRVQIEFTTAEGRLAFLRAFPHWSTTNPQHWMDVAGIEFGQSKYDLPDEFEEGDGQHRRKVTS